MKKILILLLIAFMITGCGNNNARGVVEEYLKKYKTLSSEILVDMEKMIEKENLNNDQKDVYRDILKKQYKDLTYEIIEEEYDDEVSYVTVKINVYDLYKVDRDASIYLDNNENEFYNEFSTYDYSKFNDYRLKKMKNTTDRVDYIIMFTVTKEKDIYIVEQPTENDLKKIHGIFNYELS